jgi:hypothetical protein
MHAISFRVFMISFVALASFLGALPVVVKAPVTLRSGQPAPRVSSHVYLPFQSQGGHSLELPEVTALPEVTDLPMATVTPVVPTVSATPRPPKPTYARLPMEEDYHSQVTETHLKNACGPASLLMVLDYYDLKASLDDVIKMARFSPKEGGFDPTCQVNKACMSAAALEKLAHDAYGMAVDAREGWTLEDVYAALADGKPVIADIAWQGKSSGIGHFVVIYGVDLVEKMVYYHDPFEGAARQSGWDEFAAGWSGPVDVGDPLQPTGHVGWGMSLAKK